MSVFVRSSRLDGREVLSIDLHGDGLIKGAVPPHLTSELLARAGPASDPSGARAACLPPALAQSLFNPVVNVAALDPAVRIARVGEGWVLAGSHEPQPVAKAEAPMQLAGRREPVQIVEPQPLLQLAAATTTRGAAKQKGTTPVPTTRAGQAKPGSVGTTGQSAPTSAQQVLRVASP